MKTRWGLMAIVLALAAPLAAQTVTVTSPNGGEEWTLGSSRSITWSFTNAGSTKVTIVLRHSGGVVGTIKSNVALASGSWAWTSVGRLEDGTVVAPGSDYVVRIRDGGNTFGDNSNASFTLAAVAAPTLRLVTPNGGESWTRGSTQDVIWKGNWQGNVQLSLFKGGTYIGVIASSLPSLPSVVNLYQWKVGTTNNGLAGFGGDYKVKVARIQAPLAPYPGLSDLSDGGFAISVMRLEEKPMVTTAKIAKTVSVSPAVSNVWQRKHRYTGFASESSPRPDPKPQMRTGYTNSYHPPTWQTTDWEYWGYIYRGVVRFDLSQVKGQVSEAKVSMICTGTDSTDGMPYCDGSVMVLDGPGNGFNTPWHHLVDLPAGGGTISSNLLKVSGPNIVINVTDLVKAWVNGSQPNHGLVFLGNNEEMDDESNDRCVSHFKVSLSVTYIPGM